MNRQSAAPINAGTWLDIIISAAFGGVVPGDPISAGWKIKLYKAVSAPITPASVLADFTECDFTGYAESAPANWTQPVNLPGAQGRAAYAPSLFTFTGGAPQTALGYYVTGSDATGAPLMAAEAFADPVAFANDCDYLDLAVILGLAYQTVYG